MGYALGYIYLGKGSVIYNNSKETLNIRYIYIILDNSSL